MTKNRENNLTDAESLEVRGRLSVWFMTLKRASADLSAALYFLANPIREGNYSHIAVAACIETAVMKLSTITIKGRGAGNLVKPDGPHMRPYWIRALKKCFPRQERREFLRLLDKINEVRNTRLGHVDAASMNPVNCGEMVSMGGSIQWSTKEIKFWINSCKRLSSSILELHDELLRKETVKYPPIVTVGKAETVTVPAGSPIFGGPHPASQEASNEVWGGGLLTIKRRNRPSARRRRNH